LALGHLLATLDASGHEGAILVEFAFFVADRTKLIFVRVLVAVCIINRVDFHFRLFTIYLD